MTNIDTRLLDREMKKGSAELIVLSIVDGRPRHGYEISKLIEQRSGGRLTSTSRRCIRCFTGLRSAAGLSAAGSKRPASGGGASTS